MESAKKCAYRVPEAGKSNGTMDAQYISRPPQSEHFGQIRPSGSALAGLATAKVCAMHFAIFPMAIDDAGFINP
jgi:hypothetical protein